MSAEAILESLHRQWSPYLVGSVNPETAARHIAQASQAVIAISPPRMRSLRRPRMGRLAFSSALVVNLALVLAVFMTVGTAAAAEGSLPEPIQAFFSEVAGRFGLSIPAGPLNQGAPPLAPTDIEAPPPHAGVTGSPEHAGVPGPPEHAGPKEGSNAPEHAGPPPHAGFEAPPAHAAVPGPPEHAGPPVHAGPKQGSTAPPDAGPPEHAGPKIETPPGQAKET